MLAIIASVTKTVNANAGIFESSQKPKQAVSEAMYLLKFSRLAYFVN